MSTTVVLTRIPFFFIRIFLRMLAAADTISNIPKDKKIISKSIYNDPQIHYALSPDKRI